MNRPLPERPVAALATPEGASEMALVRISGEGCRARVARVFSTEESTHGVLPDAAVAAVRRGFFELVPNAPLIPAISIEYPEGRSYTGEESVELLVPGAPAVVRGVLARLEALGIAAAAPGEFTRRAFHHGRLDLTRAESVAALIAAEDLEGTRAARRTLDGELAAAVREIGDRLHDAIALLEAGLDFADQEIEPPSPREIDRLLAPLEERLGRWVDRPDAGSAERSPLRFLLWGRANAGKSTLLNALCEENRAIVSEIPGTTTDGVAGTLETPAGTIELLDLPGRKEPRSPVEERAEALARRDLAEGDRVLYLFDAARDPVEIEAEWQSLPDEVRARSWPVLNQVDRLSGPARDALPELPDRIDCSALRGEGVAALRDRLAESRRRGEYVSRGLARLFNDRQRRRLTECRARLAAARAEMESAGRVEPELIVVDLRRAHEALEEITGEIAPDETLDRIFARFCVGK